MSSDTLSSVKVNRPFIGVGVLVWKGDTLLLGKRIHSHGKDVWQFPGGHLEVGETVTECAVREVREEAGIEITGMEQAGYTDETFSIKDRHYVTLYVAAAYDSGEVRVMEPDKCQCWEWFHYNELPSPLFGPITTLLKQVPSLSVLQVGPGAPASVQK